MSPTDDALLRAIVARAYELSLSAGCPFDRTFALFTIANFHYQRMQLDLDALLEASEEELGDTFLELFEQALRPTPNFVPRFLRYNA